MRNFINYYNISFQNFFFHKIIEEIISSSLVKLDKYPDFEIEEEYPHKIRNFTTKQEIVMIETVDGYIAKFDKDRKEIMHVIVARQFNEYEKGDGIKHIDNNKKNYDAWNLKVTKKSKAKLKR